MTLHNIELVKFVQMFSCAHLYLQNIGLFWIPELLQRLRLKVTTAFGYDSPTMYIFQN